MRVVWVKESVPQGSEIKYSKVIWFFHGSSRDISSNLSVTQKLYNIKQKIN